MNKVKKGLDNQAIGLLPLLLFMLLDNYFAYLLSFIIGVSFCIACLFLYQRLSKTQRYQFMLLPTAATLIFYAIFLCLKIEPVLFTYSPLITELLLVVVLAMTGFSKRIVLQRIRNSKEPTYKRTLLRTSLNEFYFVSQLIQNLYTLHLFAILLYSILPEYMQSVRSERFLYRELGLIIGAFLIIYEHIRLSLMHGSLKKEMWLPVLNEKGKVIGCIARSVSRTLPKKYCHPIVRIAVLYDNMLYLTKRRKDAFEAPDLLDHPFQNYVMFRDTIENTVKETLKEIQTDKTITLRYLARYIYETDKIKHMVSLYVINLQKEEQIEQFFKQSGKLWTTKQITENLNTGIFSGYFEKEFPYLQNTILLAEHYRQTGRSNS